MHEAIEEWCEVTSPACMTKLVKLEEKETLTEKEQITVSKMVKKLDPLSTEFNQHVPMRHSGLNRG